MDNFWEVIFESNIINFLVALALIIAFLPKLFKSSLHQTKDKLQQEIKDLEELRLEEERQLAEIEQRLINIEEESKNIVRTANESAVTLKNDIIKSAELEIQKIKKAAVRELEEKKEISMQQIKVTFIKEASKIVEDKFLDNLSSLNLNQDIGNIKNFKSELK